MHPLEIVARLKFASAYYFINAWGAPCGGSGSTCEPEILFKQLRRHFQICGRKSFGKLLIDIEEQLWAASARPCPAHWRASAMVDRGSQLGLLTRHGERPQQHLSPASMLPFDEESRIWPFVRNKYGTSYLPPVCSAHAKAASIAFSVSPR
jgi:hypothetical protein